MTLSVNILTGRITSIGDYSSDEHCHTLSSLQLTGSDGAVELGTTRMANQCVRGVTVGDEVSDAVSTVAGRSVAWAILNKRVGITFAGETTYTARNMAHTSLLGMAVITLIGFLMFIIPGLVLTWPLLKSWSAYRAIPTEAAIREAVASMETALPCIDFDSFGLAAVVGV